MKYKQPTFLVKYGIMVNGEEYPREIIIDADDYIDARLKMNSVIDPNGDFEIHVRAIERFYPEKV